MPVKNRGTVVVSVVLAVLALVAAWYVSGSLNLQESICSNPRYGTDVRFEGRSMKWERMVLEYLAPRQLEQPSKFLVSLNPRWQWGIIYTLAGMIGAFIPLWLQAAGVWVAASSGHLAARAVAGAATGAIVSLLLRLPAPLVEKVFAVKILGLDTTGCGEALLDSCVVLAVVSGVFMGAFYQRLPRVFAR